ARIGMGVPEEDARHFDVGLRAGGTLVTVNAGTRTEEALGILQRHDVDFGPTGARRYLRQDSSAGADYSGQRDLWSGADRRTRSDASYAGPERRLIGV
ncbi:MAG: hypothetical protein ACREMX_08085, partial [Gemmatimonadales bacterium]